MAYDFDETAPADNDYISDFPSNERAARTAKKNAFEVNHELTDGYHDVVTLNETPWAAANPDPGAGHMALYCKDHGGQPEAFLQEESAGDIIQVSEAGYLYGVLSLLAGSLEINRKALANVLLGKGIQLQGHDTAEAAYLDLISLDASDELIVGESTAGGIAKAILKAASDNADPEEQFVVDYGAGEKQIYHAGNKGDADTVDGYEGTDLLLSADATVAGRYYQSASTAIGAADSVTTFAHGLGGVPRVFLVSLVCISTDLGYAVGDEIVVSSYSPRIGDHSNEGLGCFANATHVGIVVGVGRALIIMDRVANCLWTAVDESKWETIVRAWR